MMTVTGEMIVARVRGDKGQHEVPAHSNSGPFVQAAQHASFLGGTGWPWCAAEVDYVCLREGVSLAPNNGAGAHDLADRHRSNWVTDRSKWRPGMVVDYNEGTGHTGILTDLSRLSAGYVTSTDGNWGDAVTEHEMPVSIIRAVWAIPGVHYDGTIAPPVKPKPVPAWVVTTSHNGHKKLLFVTKVGKGDSGKRRVARWIVKHSLARLAPNGITIKRAKRIVK